MAEREVEARATRVEWVVAAASALVVAAALGFAFYKAATDTDEPPVIRIDVVRVVDVGDQFAVEFWAINTGGTTADALVVEGLLRDEEGNVLESHTLTINFVPADARRKAGFYFTMDPREHELDIRAVGYDVP